MMLSKKTVNQFLKGMIAAAPAIPFVMSKRKTPIAAYVLGGLGIAVAGGIAALMFFSPKTRTKALMAAKNTYGKVDSKISHLRNGKVETPITNGIVDHDDYHPVTTGL